MNILGQHFLINEDILKKIVAALELKNSDKVVEIGPGRGELTLPLIKECLKLNCRIIAIEKDFKLIKDLKFKIQNLEFKNIKIIEGDILKLLPKLTNPPALNLKPYKIVGNIPYYITGYLLRIIGELKNKPSLIVLTIQKEVAERLNAQPPKMNLLAASVQFWAQPEIIGFIPAQSFNPVPKVDSAVIKLTPLLFAPCSALYYSFIKILFKQPRKTILNNLREKYQPEELKKAAQETTIDLNHRPQNLDLKQIIQLSACLPR